MTPDDVKTWTHDGRPELNRMGIPAADGPWMDEPDKAHWIDQATNLDCLAVRNPLGAWCGYVGLPPEHPWHGKGYDSCLLGSECDEEWCYEHSPNGAVQVHGGLTYANACQQSDDEANGICHVPLPGRPHDVWWFGFDCAHLGDQSPYDVAKAEYERHRYPWNLRPEDVYRDLAYVKDECSSLARQLAEVTA